MYAQLIVSHWCKKSTQKCLILFKRLYCTSCNYFKIYTPSLFVYTCENDLRYIWSVNFSLFLTIETLELYKLLHYQKKILDIFLDFFYLRHKNDVKKRNDGNSDDY